MANEGGRVKRMHRAAVAVAHKQDAPMRSSGKVTQLTYIKRQIPLYEVIGEEGLEKIEANADRLLEETGIDFRGDAEALDMWKQAGADVRGERVRFPKGMLRDLLKTAPKQFTQHARNPARSVEVGGNNTIFAPVYGPPFVRDLRRWSALCHAGRFSQFCKTGLYGPINSPFRWHRVRTC